MTASVVQFPARPAPKVPASVKLAFTMAQLRKMVADPATPPSLADSKQPGLHLRRAKSGRWFFWFEKRVAKRLYKKALTPWADRLDLDVIRQDAADLLRAAQTGHWAADVMVNPRTGWAWAQALEDHTELNKLRPNTAAQSRCAFRAFGPSLPKLVKDLDGPAWRDIYRRAIGKGVKDSAGKTRVLTPATASAYARCISAVWTSWAWGFKQEARPAVNPISDGMASGPRKGLWKNPEPRTGHLTIEQIGPWLKALRQRSEAINPTHASACAALELLTLTGLRSGEALGLTWAEVGDDGWFAIGAARMKAKAAFRRPITRRVAQILNAQREITGGVGFVFPSWKVAGAHLVDLRKAMAPIAEAVGAPDLTPHDLRRTWASISKAQRVDAAIEKRLMAHSLRDDVHEQHYANAVAALLQAEAQRIEDVMMTGAVR